MIYKLTKPPIKELPSDFMRGELLLQRNSPNNTNADFFIFLGKAGEFLRLGRVRLDRQEHRVETIEEISIHSSERDQFGRLSGLLAVEADLSS
jgi:hypothetical protein